FSARQAVLTRRQAKLLYTGRRFRLSCCWSLGTRAGIAEVSNGRAQQCISLRASDSLDQVFAFGERRSVVWSARVVHVIRCCEGPARVCVYSSPAESHRSVSRV